MIDDPLPPPDGPGGDPEPGSGDDHPARGDISLFHASWPEPRRGLDFASIVDQYGQRLFVLAYRLTGDRDQAEELSQKVLVSSRGALAGGDWSAFDLCRALVSDWRASLGGRWGMPALAAPWRRPGRAAGIAHGGDWLQAALLRLGPRDREVLVLRVGEGLDYEEIAATLGDAVGVVQRRLSRARRHLHDVVGHRAGGARGGPARRGPRLHPAAAAERAMNLYLDDRLSRSGRTEFDRRLEEDSALRAEVEFHRGLTLEFQEEAPFLPRDYARRTLARMEREGLAAAIGGGAAVFGRAHLGRRWRRPGALVALAGAAALLLAVGVPGALRWIAARRAPSQASTAPGVGGAATPPDAAAQADEQTLQALRSLGYLGSGAVRKGAVSSGAHKGAVPRRKAGEKQAPMAAARPRGSPAPAPRTTPAATPAPNPLATPAAPAATPRPVETPVPAPAAGFETAPAPEPGPSPATEPPPAGGPGPATETAPAPGPSPAESPAPVGEAIGHDAVPAPRAPEAGRDHEVIGSPESWAALHSAAGSPAPAVDFETSWVVLLRDALGTDPPSRLRVAAVRRVAGSIEIDCRAEAADAAAPGPPPGQALVLPRPISPVKVLIR